LSQLKFLFVLESKEELQELWHRLNISIEAVEIALNYKIDKFDFTFNEDYSMDLWEVLDKLMEERNIKP